MRVALSEGRLSRWQELLQLTPREVTVLQAYYRIEPWGEERADLREAVMATSLAASMSMQPIPQAKAVERVKNLCSYLGCEEEVVTPNAMSAAMKGAFPSRSI